MKINLKNREVLIDKDKMHVYNSRVWHISDTGYVVWRGIENGTKKTIRLHRLIIGANDNEIVDHINRNKLDNRLNNLRICSFKENIHNSDRYESAKGYYYDNRKKRWTIDFKRYGVKGIYVDTEKDAIDYIKHLKSGNIPVRSFTRKVSLGSRKLTKEKAKMIDELWEQKIPRYKIGEKLGLSRYIVGRYISGKTWNKTREYL